MTHEVCTVLGPDSTLQDLRMKRVPVRQQHEACSTLLPRKQHPKLANAPKSDRRDSVIPHSTRAKCESILFRVGLTWDRRHNSVPLTDRVPPGGNLQAGRLGSVRRYDEICELTPVSVSASGTDFVPGLDSLE
ncbi:hypothetical protein POX_a00917 [Penicillium oxalicum]|uniref:Uncharacterized protein n=1 Tax=Penicillium oxalicum (strain 114-2 / CGMCC 5302) TaxID=933388 RepID=S7ZZ48_PENO1|nr:hypothetical protein POX_a00917 [Penicillium oxalicum]EPS34101.1 hypothetical protein PDE_09063 [Penicillium oxalicum 114-2]KAI2794322.1 hypothetical protein POX_a00917 [Penicillium oxalicum]